jgi:hypothetical protein
MMKKSILNTGFSLLLATTLFSFNIPEGWMIAGSKPAFYEMGIAPGQGRDGKNAATIKAIVKRTSEFGTLMQNFLPDSYIGKKIKLTAYAKSENIKGWAGFWMRVDQHNTDKSLPFDNMFNRPIKGTTEWTKYEIVLDVPEKASNIAYGCLLSGSGQIWFDDFSFEVVGEASKPTHTIQTKPLNTGFED